MFGIAWGVGSLLSLVGLGEGFRSGNRKQFDSLGENVMFIWSARAPVMQGSFTALRQYYLTYRDYQDISRECPSVRPAAPVIQRSDIRAVSDFFPGQRTNHWECRRISTRFATCRSDEGRWINDLDDCAKTLGDRHRRRNAPHFVSGPASVGASICSMACV